MTRQTQRINDLKADYVLEDWEDQRYRYLLTSMTTATKWRLAGKGHSKNRTQRTVLWSKLSGKAVSYETLDGYLTAMHGEKLMNGVFTVLFYRL